MLDKIIQIITKHCEEIAINTGEVELRLNKEELPLIAKKINDEYFNCIPIA